MIISAARSTASSSIDAFDTDVLLAFLLKKDRAYLLAHGDESLSFSQKIQFASLIRRRKKGVPVAYLTGTKEFYGLEFFVNKYTLIPRPETELMVEQAVTIISSHASHTEDTSDDMRDEFPNRHPIADNQTPLLIDIGTGSGCIPISVIKTLEHPSSPEGYAEVNLSTGSLEHGSIKTPKVFAIDISAQALIVANENAKRHHADITFLKGSLLEPIQQHNSITHTSHIIITANLPYLTDKQFAEEPSIQHEPKSALVAPNSGLLFYEVLTRQIVELIEEKACAVTALYEIDPSQTHTLTDIILEELPTAHISVHKDYCGNDRMIQFSTVA